MNPYALRHMLLRHACLPISPPRRKRRKNITALTKRCQAEVSERTAVREYISLLSTYRSLTPDTIRVIVYPNITLIFFLLLIPLAGFIAWAGDRIGHKSGKRRQSLLGLRPRHTAMVFTVGSGMAIALVSFGLFYALSETFRVVVRDGTELYRHNVELKGENKRQAALLAETRQTTKIAQAETKRYNQERQTAEAATNKALAESDKAERLRAGAEKRAGAAQKNFQQAAKGRDKAQDELIVAQTELTEIQSLLKNNTARFREVKRRLTLATRRVTTAEANAKTAEGQYQAATKERDVARADVEYTKNQAIAVLERQRKLLTAEIDAVQEKLETQNRDFNDLQTKTVAQRFALTTLTEELEKRRAEYDRLVVATGALRQKQITFQVGEEVERISLRSGYSPWRLQGMVRAFLNNAAKKAERRGAKKGDEDRAVDIASNGVFADGETLTISGKGDEDDAIRAAADAIRKLNQEVVVLAVSRANAVVGEPVPIDLQIHRNPVVLREGEKISEGVISSDGTRQVTANALAAYMSQDVHSKLVGAGMLPVSRGGETETAVGEVGRADSEFTLNGEDWLKLVEDVRRAGTAAKVQVFAAKDMRAGDPIALKFTVREQPSEQAQK